MCCGADPGRTAGGARLSRSRKMSSVIAAAAGTRRDEPVHGLQGDAPGPALAPSEEFCLQMLQCTL